MNHTCTNQHIRCEVLIVRESEDERRKQMSEGTGKSNITRNRGSDRKEGNQCITPHQNSGRENDHKVSVHRSFIKIMAFKSLFSDEIEEVEIPP